MALDLSTAPARRARGSPLSPRVQVASGFTPPPARAGTVPRRDLVGALRRSGAPLVVLSAPAGFGKTTVLSQWAAEDPRPFWWIALEPERLGPDRLGAALARLRAPGVLVLDDAHLAGGDVLDTVRRAVMRLPPGAQIALAGRAEPAMRVGLLRSRGLLLRLGAPDLAMSVAEAARLLEAAGLRLGPPAVAALVERTEGWPAALHLCALSLAGRDDPERAALRLGGDDRLVAEYVEDEVVAALTVEQVDLLELTAVLERLSAAACDAVLEDTGSGALLAGIERSGGIVVPLDPGHEVYRHQRLVGEVVRAGLWRRRPELVPVLHRRASAWFARAGEAAPAIRHALAAGDEARVAELVAAWLPGRLATGRLAGLAEPLAALPPATIGRGPALALATAWCGVEVGAPDVDHWAEVAGRAAGAASAEPPSVAAGLHLLRAALAADGADAMRESAARAGRLRADDGAWCALACALEGIALQVSGDAEHGRGKLQEALRRAGPELPYVELLCRGWLSAMAACDGDWDCAAAMGARAERVVAREGLSEYASGVLAHAGATLRLARAGEVEGARRRRAEARRLLAVAPDVAPWRQAMGRLLLARASGLMGDPGAARMLLDEAREWCGRLPGAGALEAHLRAARQAVEGSGACGLAHHAPLTAAEARVLRFLPTHHSFRDIGEQLHVSRFTVKSQALSIYRKLAVSSRGEAVARARALDLLDDEPS